MLRKFSVQLLGVGLILLVTGSFAMAQRRVNFARGRTTATVSGTVNAKGAATFAVRCFSGQLITATVRSSNGRVVFDDYNPNMYSVMTDHNGDYYITILNHGGASRYSVTISIR